MEKLNKEDLKTGDVLHCTRNKVLSRLIRWFTKSEFNHSAIVVKAWGEVYIVDAQRKGVSSRPYEDWIEEFNYSYLVARNPKGVKSVPNFSKKVFSRVGTTAYDFTNLLLTHPWHIITGKWKGKEDTINKMVCSEFAAWCWDIEDAYKITPQRLYEITKERSWKFFVGKDQK